MGLCALLLVGTGARAAGQERPARWRAAWEGGNAPGPGDTTAVLLAVSVEDEWYIYAPSQPAGGPFPMEVAVDGPLVVAGSLVAPRVMRYPDRNFNIISHVYRRTAEFTLPVIIVVGDRRPEAMPSVLVRFQACTGNYCLPPRTDTLPVDGGLAGVVADVPSPPPQEPVAAVSVALPTTVAIDSSRASSAVSSGVDDARAPAESGGGGEAISETPQSVPAPLRSASPAVSFSGTLTSLPRFLALAAMFGFLAILTPCVLPLVPVTVGFFGSRFSRGGAQSRSIAAPVLFAGGIVLSFAGLGMLASLLLGAGGMATLAANPWVNLAVAALFVAFGLNLLGLYELVLPARLLQKVAGGDVGSGSGVAMLAMGAAFTVTSFTCTAPFVGTLLVLASQGGWQWPLLGLTVYAAAFALPFFLLALSPRWLSRVPRSGQWMITLLRVLGVVEVAAALKFVSNADMVAGWGLLPRSLMIGLWMAAALIVAGLALFHASPTIRRPGPARLTAAGGSVGLALWLSTGLGGTRLGELESYLPPAGNTASAMDPAGELSWVLNDYEASLRRSRSEDRPLLVDFTGYTCTNCRWMEANMFPRQEVAVVLEDFVRVRLFTDGLGEPYRTQQALQAEMFGTVALPFYAVLSPGGEPVATFLGMTRNTSEFVRFLEAGLASSSRVSEAPHPALRR